ncbi:hypothetical protein [Lacticaseibacillus absianus]|uniref:hypothetical protein n=1 Tax=Lacticaseibacillus absianus TaxID=2729623 RepID=UPI0015CD59B2|nr:hypothetical protein [Lacticaseibacillus absianus]
MEPLTAEEERRWVRQRKTERATLWVGAVIAGILLVRGFYIGNLMSYWLRFGPFLFVAVCIEDAIETRWVRRRNRHYQA